MFGERLKLARKKAGLSLRNFSAQLEEGIPGAGTLLLMFHGSVN